MKLFPKLAFTLAFATTAAFASEHLTQAQDYARSLTQEFRAIHQATKAKTFSPADVQNHINTTTETLGKLKATVAEYEAANPAAANNPEWGKAKQLVTLLEIFHNNKLQLLQGNATKNRSQIGNHAKGLVVRSEMLQQATERMLKTQGS
jgi:hypothetical protein